MFCPADVHGDLSQFLKQQKKDKASGRRSLRSTKSKSSWLHLCIKERLLAWRWPCHDVRCTGRPVRCSLLYVFTYIYNWSSKHWLVTVVLHVDVAHRNWAWSCESIVKANTQPVEQDRLTRFFDSIGFRSVFSNFSFLEQGFTSRIAHHRRLDLLGRTAISNFVSWSGLFVQFHTTKAWSWWSRSRWVFTCKRHWKSFP